ncbi:MAG TPA: alpha/beta hydrolase [Candidatus Sulfotelmatobacter sp.]|nr:alpha/beta hydrolase [Candidatus Sulfotelmatobacter sp.]
MFAHYAFSRRDVTFEAEGATLVGWFYRPQRDGDLPAIVMSHGFACVKELFVDRFAEAFAQAGFAVLLYDHRNFGASGGEPRGEIDPWRQVSDMRDAVTWMTMQPGIDVSRLGLWGSSYSGGHVLTLAAQDRRVACVVAQVPTISGGQSFLRRVPPGSAPEVRRQFAEDRRRRMQGAEPQRRRVIPEGAEPGIYNGDDAVAFWRAAAGIAPSWVNSVTLRSSELASGYEPGLTIASIGPTPLLMVVAECDDVTPTDLALAAYQRALEPKRLCLIPGGHFDPYQLAFAAASGAALDWFLRHLG